MVVESDAHRVHWMSPSDMIFDEIFSGRRDDETNLFTSHHPGGFQVGMADGSARYVSGEVPVKELKAALLINDGKSGRLD
jgi:prepilin-type processing-associated H-X9-DG protein